MRYPYIIYSNKINIEPIFRDLIGEPLIVDMSINSQIFDTIDVRDQKNFQRYLEKKMGDEFKWGVSSYFENREVVLSECPQMVEEKRFFHLGLDIIVPLKKPLFAPLASVVQETGYEPGEGNYGNYILLKHESDFFDTFYSFYGHLCKEQLASLGQSLKAGEQFALIGDFHENGNWFYHTHLQVITQKGLDNGYLSKGYCSKNDLGVMEELCPNPLPLFVK